MSCGLSIRRRERLEPRPKHCSRLENDSSTPATRHRFVGGWDCGTFFWLGKLFGARTVYIEVIDRVDSRTLTARLVFPVTDAFLAQDPSQLDLFPGSILIGELL